MIFYFTYNDQPSGVYFSQVCDVVNYMNSIPGERARLFALVSARAWRSIRRDIRNHSADAIVLPMIPRASNWKWNVIILALLQLIYRPKAILARGVFAGNIARMTRRFGFRHRIGFDGRGAYAAEWQEYEIVPDKSLISQVKELEERMVNQSDFRLAVSNALVAHWKEEFGYDGTKHVVIPCTLTSARDLRLNMPEIASRRTELGYGPDDIVLVYAGSTAGWQSFSLLQNLLSKFLDMQSCVQVLFLSKEDENIRSLIHRYEGRVKAEWLRPEQVHSTLSVCDYGILIREDTVTNRVASPTKFAEYLAAGLKVLISPHIGDMGQETEENGLGMQVSAEMTGKALDRVDISEKRRAATYARTHYTKEAYQEAYANIKKHLTA